MHMAFLKSLSVCAGGAHGVQNFVVGFPYLQHFISCVFVEVFIFSHFFLCFVFFLFFFFLYVKSLHFLFPIYATKSLKFSNCFNWIYLSDSYTSKFKNAFGIQVVHITSLFFCHKQFLMHILFVDAPPTQVKLHDLLIGLPPIQVAVYLLFIDVYQADSSKLLKK